MLTQKTSNTYFFLNQSLEHNNIPSVTDAKKAVSLGGTFYAK